MPTGKHFGLGPDRDDYPHPKHLTVTEVASQLHATPSTVKWWFMNWLHYGKVGPTSLPGYRAGGRIMFHPDDVTRIARWRKRHNPRMRNKPIFEIPPNAPESWVDMDQCPHCSGPLKRALNLLKDGQHAIICPRCNLPLSVEKETRVLVKTTITLDEERLRLWRERKQD